MTQPSLFGTDSRPVAHFSACNRFRWRLDLRWAPGPVWTWCMLNPSVAGSDTHADGLDPTLRRCRGFSQAGGAGGFVIVNLWPFVGQDPASLWAAYDAGVDITGGAQGLAEVEWAAGEASVVVCGWGDFSKGAKRHKEAGRLRAAKVVEAIVGAGRQPMALSVTQRGQPGHPLYLSSRLVPVPWIPCGREAEEVGDG